MARDFGPVIYLVILGAPFSGPDPGGSPFGVADPERSLPGSLILTAPFVILSAPFLLVYRYDSVLIRSRRHKDKVVRTLCKDLRDMGDAAPSAA